MDAHLRDSPTEGMVALGTDLVMCHEITTPPAIIEIAEKYNDEVFDASRIFAVIDHVTPAKDTKTAQQGQVLREWALRKGIEFADIGRNGVCHAILPEKRLVRPGMTVVCGDSHTCTHGAFGALAIGVGTTALEAALLTGVVFTRKPKVMRIQLNGELLPGVSAKDVILCIIGQIGVSGATDHVIEFMGPAASTMTMEERMTVSNMSVEAGATSGLFLPDGETAAWLSGFESVQHMIISNYGGGSPTAHRAHANSFRDTWYPDPNAQYGAKHCLDVSEVVPQVTWGAKPSDTGSVLALTGTSVDQVYIGSCTNGRISDLRIAAEIIKGHTIPTNVRCIVVPATVKVQRKAIAEGLAEIFIDAGCEFSAPTCGPCLGMSNGVLAPGEVCASTTNRNFAGRMGKGGTVHLMSPATAAATALTGKITDPREVIVGA